MVDLFWCQFSRISTVQDGSLHLLLKVLLARKAFLPQNYISQTWIFLGARPEPDDSMISNCVDSFMLHPVWIFAELKPCRENLKNAVGMDRHCKDLRQIIKGEVMFLDKIEPDLISVISLKEDQVLIFYFLYWLLNATTHSIIISKTWS